MTAIRRRVRLVALVWLLGQTAALSAFVPEQCCLSHAEEAAAKSKDEACHETSPQPEPSHHQQGDACPMHASPMSPSHDCCVMTNACDGPGTQLTTLFAYIGYVEKPSAAAIVLESSAAVMPAPPAIIQRVALPDSPPPKA